MQWLSRPCLQGHSRLRHQQFHPDPICVQRANAIVPKSYTEKHDNLELVYRGGCQHIAYY